MHVEIGHALQPNGRSEPFYWAPQDLINAHMVIMGDSGTGKTHNVRRFCAQIARTAGPGLQRVHVLDPHGDITVQSSHVRFSQSTPFSFNPLEVNPDPDYGGVRRAINHFIALLQRTSQKLGPRQEAVLRNILLDVYQQRGFIADNPATWGLDERGRREAPQVPDDRVYLDIPYEEKDIAKEAARAEGLLLQFDSTVRCWWATQRKGELLRWPQKTWGKQFPTIHDVISLAQFKLKQLFIGADHISLLALQDLCRAQAALINKIKSTAKRAGAEDPDALQAERDRAAGKAVEAFHNFVEKAATGQELEELIRYESADTLKSIVDRLDTLRASGVCRSVAPPFDPSELVWRYNVSAYADDEKRIFVENVLERIFQKAVARGPVDHVTDVIIIDEAPKFMEDDDDHVIMRIINEARKFGIALFLISQSPTQFPDQILAGVGCKIILGLDSMYHKMGASKLGLEQKYIEKIKPTQLVLVNQKRKQQTDRWYAVRLDGDAARGAQPAATSSTHLEASQV